MGVMHFLKGYYSGTLGETVGGKWKHLGTVRVKVAPSNPNTPPQQHQRNVFGELSKALSLFAPQLKPFAGLDTRKMSLRNKIIQINKEAMAPDTVDWTEVIISRGSLPSPGNATALSGTPTGGMRVAWSPVTSQLISADARAVVVILHRDQMWAKVQDGLYSAGTMDIAGVPSGSTDRTVWLYIFDKRGYAKVSSVSVQATIS